MAKDLLIKHVVDKTDAIYAYISKRIIADSEVNLKKADCSIMLQFDGLESSRIILTEQCYEYFLFRLPTGIDYFLRTNSSEENLIGKFHGYIFKLFLRNLVIDFNRKLTRKNKKEVKKDLLEQKLSKHQLSLTEKEKSLITEYIFSEHTQKEIAQKFETSRATVNRAIKKLERLDL